ncbi:MAG: hypothetical protein U9O98_04555, partial [Asgard group archaeon]|nr:hypothetical protein [Asgard group archaeon]
EDFSNDLYKDPLTDVWWSSSTVTNRRNQSITSLDFIETKYPVSDLEVQGRKIYSVSYNTSSFSKTVNIYDITDPTNIRHLIIGMQIMELLVVQLMVMYFIMEHIRLLILIRL